MAEVGNLGKVPTIAENTYAVESKIRNVLSRIDGVNIGSGKITKEISESNINSKYICESFEGIGREVQNNFNKFLRENVWCDETLSNSEKIEIMKKNFEKLKPEQKKDFNVLSDARVINNPDYSNWGEWLNVNWPDFPGLDKNKEVLGISRENLMPEHLDRFGSPGGKNFGVIPENGKVYSMNERSICYIDNEFAYNDYSYFDNEHYFDVIDCIKNNDVDALNKVIDDINKKNETNLGHISENKINLWNKDYKAFQKDAQLIALCNEKGIDTTYGVMGKAAPWYAKDGSIITNGGAEQINTPVKGDVLWWLGILK